MVEFMLTKTTHSIKKVFDRQHTHILHSYYQDAGQ